MIAVIGSGPCGVACAETLLKKGQAVTVIDGGIDLEPEISVSLSKLSSLPFDEWDNNVIHDFKSKSITDVKGVQLKYTYGSDFPYRNVDKYIPRTSENIGHLTPSLAVGGFSNVWGSAILPYTERDLAKWPIKLVELEPFYRSILTSLPVAAEHDDLEELFPLYCEHHQPLEKSTQIKGIYDRLKRYRSRFSNSGIRFGGSRLAVDASGHTLRSRACTYCGLCLFGCPYGLIYNSGEALKRLKNSANLKHISGLLVKSLVENDGMVEIHALDLKTDKVHTLKASKVFLAAGAISSTKILLRSLMMHEREVEMKVSEYFMLPLLKFGCVGKIESERLHTLAQLFMEVDDAALCENLIHLQLYGYSELFSMALSKPLRYMGPFKQIIKNQLLGRLMVIQGYLHSDQSSRISITLRNDAVETLALKGMINPDAKGTIRQLVYKLLKLSYYTGMLPIAPVLSIGKPGEGRHAGATFPMRSTISNTPYSDRQGRPMGMRNVHLVDTSNFPTIPAPTITLTAMANAQRIVNEAV